MRLNCLLNAKGIHYLIRRFGPTWLRSKAFDEKYQSGAWEFHSESKEMSAVATKYLRGGDLLMPGCGIAAILEGLDPSGFSSVLGVDLSEEGIRRARQFEGPKIAFQTGDMVQFQCPSDYDVILFAECLYYVGSSQQLKMLKNYASHLKPGGVIIVTFAQAKRYASILELIRQNFEVIEDRSFSGSSRHLMIFR
jgi:2-polyprenyl-3-methyl-5-hydroxy-6-metoxy-1,4-benzoquinol methylase